MTSHREVIAAFKARSLFQVTDLEIFCNLCTENLENNAFENTETFVIMACCASVDNHIPRDDIFEYHPHRECNIYILLFFLSVLLRIILKCNCRP